MFTMIRARSLFLISFLSIKLSLMPSFVNAAIPEAQNATNLSTGDVIVREITPGPQAYDLFNFVGTVTSAIEETSLHPQKVIASDALITPTPTGIEILVPFTSNLDLKKSMELLPVAKFLRQNLHGAPYLALQTFSGLSSVISGSSQIVKDSSSRCDKIRGAGLAASGGVRLFNLVVFTGALGEEIKSSSPILVLISEGTSMFSSGVLVFSYIKNHLQDIKRSPAAQPPVDVESQQEERELVNSETSSLAQKTHTLIFHVLSPSLSTVGSTMAIVSSALILSSSDYNDLAAQFLEVGTVSSLTAASLKIGHMAIKAAPTLICNGKQCAQRLGQALAQKWTEWKQSQQQETFPLGDQAL